MTKALPRNAILQRQAARQLGLLSRAQARSAGLSDREIRGRVARGEWVQVHAGIYRIAGGSHAPEQRLLAACMAAGPAAVASHASAAWLWGLVPSPPSPPSVLRPGDSRPRARGVAIHRTGYLDARRVQRRRGVPCTDPARSVLDLAAVARPEELRLAIDAGLATGLFGIDALEAELEREGRCGRRGAGFLRRELAARGLTGTPAPSVLESKVHRLLANWGIKPVGVEVALVDGRYRVDVLVTPTLAVEVAGYAYHWSPEQMAGDAARHNTIQLAGVRLLLYTWRDVAADGERVGREIRQALDGEAARLSSVVRRGQRPRAGT